MEFIDLKKQYSILKDKIDENINQVLTDGTYIMGNKVKEFEKNIAEYVGTKYCVTCANGTDALSLALKTLDIKKGDAVFVPSFTFFATAEVVSNCGATPIFIDSDINTFNIDVNKIEKAIIDIKKENNLIPKAIIPVDLFGLPADFEKIEIIAKKYNLYIIEDGAQGFGGSIKGKKACSFGDIATTSFFPAKPLGCYGDGGAIFTNDEKIYHLLCSIRVHGKGKEKYDNIRIGVNSRLDTIQAAILLVKLEAFKSYELKDRNIVAQIYRDCLKDIVQNPYINQNFISSYAQYTIKLNSKEERDYLKLKLQEIEIPSMIYYPKPLHRQIVYEDYNFNLEDLKLSEKLSDIVLSLPMHPYLEEKDIINICDNIKKILKEFRTIK
ncbi:MAG: DegT/DnrJ/EryC1/StrS family aminotransferase [Clostridia bacterium]